MKTITIRDLRLHWPKTEKTLRAEKELIITRDGEPVAKLVRLLHKPQKLKRWNPDKHAKWLKKMWGGKPVRLTEKYLQADREDRKLSNGR